MKSNTTTENKMKYNKNTMTLKGTLARYGTGRRQADEDDRPFGLSAMIQMFCQACENPACTAKHDGGWGIGCSRHGFGTFLVSVTDGVSHMRCRACANGVLSCHVQDADFLEQTCHPGGGCDVSFEGSTGRLSVCCHLCCAALGGATVTEAPRNAEAPRQPALGGDRPGGAETPLGLPSLRLTADLNREMTERERRYYTENMPRLDLPPAVVVPTRGGGSLKLSVAAGLVTLVATGAGLVGFAMSFSRTEFIRALVEGGHWECPGVGQLVATPRGRGRVRLCLVARRGKGIAPGIAPGGFSFVADLSIPEVLERL